MTTPRRPSTLAGATARKDHRLSQPDVAAQLVADILKQKVEEVKQDKVERQRAVLRKRRRSKLWYSLALLPLFLGLTIWNLTRASTQPTVFTPEELDASLRFKMFLAAQAVQAYRDSAGTWPSSLAVVGMEDAALVYQLADTSYTIADTSGGVPLVYHSGETLAPFADGYALLARRRSH
ncbi:MAG: hypothetical protein HYS40_09225 [Gemmatimonadetes bacterium]|nr:hypothetical protein [Gemmatimonadota bacterium]